MSEITTVGPELIGILLWTITFVASSQIIITLGVRSKSVVLLAIGSGIDGLAIIFLGWMYVDLKQSGLIIEAYASVIFCFIVLFLITVSDIPSILRFFKADAIVIEEVE